MFPKCKGSKDVLTSQKSRREKVRLGGGGGQSLFHPGCLGFYTENADRVRGAV